MEPKKLLGQIRKWAHLNDNIVPENYQVIFGNCTLQYFQYDGRHDPRLILSVGLSPDEQGEKDLEVYHDMRFKFFEVLHPILDVTFTESTNDDACSFSYEFNAEHMSYEKVTFTLTITDYLT